MMVCLCRFCGFQESVARQFVDGCEQHDGGHEYVEVNDDQIGPVGPGTPAARMCWLWGELRQYEAWLREHGGYHPFLSDSRGMTEVALIRALKAITEVGA